MSLSSASLEFSAKRTASQGNFVEASTMGASHGLSSGLGARGLVRLIKGYQRHVSGLKSAPTCRFTPSCSEYAAVAITRFGAVKGTWLATWRIARCNPFVEGGDDPVPEHFPRHPRYPSEKTNP